MQENHNIINVGSYAIPIRFQYIINLTLNVCWQVFSLHNCNIKALLSLMANNHKFMLIQGIYLSLIVEKDTVDDGDMRVIANRKNDMRL